MTNNNEVNVREPVEGLQGHVWESVTSGLADEFWTPGEPGDNVQGVITGSYSSDMGVTWILDVKGRAIGLPSHTVLGNALHKLKIGSLVRITYLGGKKSEKGREYKDYRVEVARPTAEFV